MTNKLDPDLRSRLRAHRARQEARVAAAPPTAAPADVEQIELGVEFTGSIADLVAIGFVPRTVIEHPTEPNKIVTGTIPADRLEALAAIPHLVQAEGPRRLRPLLDYSVPEIRADTLHTASPAHLGRGVVIGIIDTGIDWRHGTFVKPDNTSRILAIWDQTLSAAGETSGPGNSGLVYTQQQISQALQGTGSVRSNDRVGHGTHVAGIAAGNGRPATCCHDGNTYVGVAPEADIIAVKRTFGIDVGENIRIVDALQYIFNHPETAGKSVVVNISLSTQLGAHDGTSLVESAIDYLVATPRRAVVVAAGNSGSTGTRYSESRSHVQGTVQVHADREVEFEIPEGTQGDSFLDLWYDRAGTLNLEVIRGDESSGPVLHGAHHAPFVINPNDFSSEETRVEIIGNINEPLNRNNNFRVTIHRSASGKIASGSWKLKLTNPAATSVGFHCWIDGPPGHAPGFLEPGSDGRVRSSSDSTICVPATAAKAISVANHESRTGRCDCCPSTGIHETSSRGPVARNAGANPKPDIAAPGMVIASAKADAANLRGNCCSCCSDSCCCLYTDDSGTSMSAPHVTGTIALMLEKNPTLTRDQILQYLQDSARDRPAGGRDDTWGAGKLNAKAALDLVPAAGGGGSGGSGPTIRLANDVEDEHLAGGTSLPPALRILRARIGALPDGPYVAAVVSRNFSEVRRLINTNQRVAAMWHRGEGPRMLRRILSGALDADAPAAILTGEQRAHVERWWDILAHHGSRRLQANIERHRARLMDLLGSPLAAQVSLALPLPT